MTDDTAKAILAEDCVQALKRSAEEALKFIQQIVGAGSFNMADGYRAQVRLVDALNQFTEITAIAEESKDGDNM